MFGWLERREDLPFGEEPPLNVSVVESAADDLDRDPAAKLAVVPLGEIDDAHAAASELAQHAIRADVADRRVVLDEERCREASDRTLERAVRSIVRRQQ